MAEDTQDRSSHVDAVLVPQGATENVVAEVAQLKEELAMALSELKIAQVKVNLQKRRIARLLRILDRNDLMEWD